MLLGNVARNQYTDVFFLFVDMVKKNTENLLVAAMAALEGPF